ncbi:MAG: NYN domain-containing protein [Bacteroidota bacterium]
MTVNKAAAVLIDYQNLYYYLKNRLTHPGSPSDTSIELIEGLRRHLDAEGVHIGRGFAYADFAGIDEHVRHVQRALYLNGIQPQFVPSTMHRNTSDLQMAIDAIRLSERFDIGTYVLVSGDRDYVPIVQALKARGVRVLVVAFRDHLSARLLEQTGMGAQVNAETLLSADTLDLLEEENQTAAPAGEVTTFSEVTDPPNERDYDALEIIEEFFGQYDEIYLTPLLRRLSEELGEMDDHDPKSLIGDLEECGAVRLERRRGMPYDYTVLIVNDEHPAVVEVRADFAERDTGDESEEDTTAGAAAPDAGPDAVPSSE